MGQKPAQGQKPAHFWLENFFFLLVSFSSLLSCFLSSSLLLFSVFFFKFLSLRRMMNPPLMLMDEWCAGVYAQKTGRFPNTPLSDNHPGAPFSPSPSCASFLSALESRNSGSNSLLRESSWDSLPEDRSGSGSDSDSATIDLTGTRFPSIPGATTVRGAGASLVSPLSPRAPETKRRKSGSGGRTGRRIVARPKQRWSCSKSLRIC